MKKINEKTGKSLAVCLMFGVMTAALMTGCENQSEETSTVAQAEISTAMEEKESSKLDGINLEAYEKLSDEEKTAVLALYLEELYRIEETKLPEGEEYDEVLLALKPAVEAVMKNHPDETMQELLEQANTLKEDQEGMSIEEFFAQEMDKELTE